MYRSLFINNCLRPSKNHPSLHARRHSVILHLSLGWIPAFSQWALLPLQPFLLTMQEFPQTLHAGLRFWSSETMIFLFLSPSYEAVRNPDCLQAGLLLSHPVTQIPSACSDCLPVLPRTSPVDRDGHLPPLETSATPFLAFAPCIASVWSGFCTCP